MNITAPRKLLIMLLVVVMFLQPATMTYAEAKSHHNKKHSDNRIVVMEASKNGKKVKFPRNNLKVPKSNVLLFGKKNGILLIEEHSFLFDIDPMGHLNIEMYPGGDAGLYLPGRGYVEKKYPKRIGHSSIYVYGWFVDSLTRDYYRHGKHYVDITIESPGYKQKIRFVRKGKEWTLTVIR